MDFFTARSGNPTTIDLVSCVADVVVDLDLDRCADPVGAHYDCTRQGMS